jgi:hypothetical protein
MTLEPELTRGTEGRRASGLTRDGTVALEEPIKLFDRCTAGERHFLVVPPSVSFDRTSKAKESAISPRKTEDWSCLAWRTVRYSPS